MTQTELLTSSRLELNTTVRKGTPRKDCVLMRSAAGRVRLVLTPAQSAVLCECFVKPATVPESLARLLGEHRCPPLDEYYELVLQAHAAGVLVAEGGHDGPTLTCRWPLRLPFRAAGAVGLLLLAASGAALLIPRWVAPDGWTQWVAGWAGACALLTLGQVLAACVLSGGACEVRALGLRWFTLLPHLCVDTADASMEGRAREQAVAVLRVVPVAVGAALFAWRRPELLAPALAALFYVLAPWSGTAASQWMRARAAQPRFTVRSGFLFENRRKDSWEQVRAWRKRLNPRFVLLGLLWLALIGGACLRLFPDIMATAEAALGTRGRLHPLLEAALYSAAAALVIIPLLLLRSLFGHWLFRRRLARPLRSDSARAAVAAALKGDPAAVLRQVPLFQTLAEENITALAVTVRLVQVAAEKDVFREDDPGDAFYIVLEGALEITKRRPKSANRVDVIGRLGPGDGFGEIALLEGTVRTATVRTTRPCQLLRLMTEDFERLVVQRVGAERVRELLQNTAFLGRLVFLAGWSFDDLFRYAQKCGTVRFEAGYKVLTKGAANNWFYLIFDGAFEACDGKKVLRRMQPGDYFGEISLLEHGEATADVVATEESRCLTMTRTDFQQFFAKDFRIGLRMEELAARRLGSSLFSSR